LVLVVAVGACQFSSTHDDGSQAEPSGAAPAPANASAAVRPKLRGGGSVTSAGARIVSVDGGAVVDIPAGAVEHETEVKITLVSPPIAPEALASFVIEPAAMRFLAPVTVMLSLPSAIDPTTVRIVSEGVDGRFAPVGLTIYDRTTARVVTFVDHSSRIAAFPSFPCAGAVDSCTHACGRANGALSDACSTSFETENLDNDSLAPWFRCVAACAH
jgi:hypothetical protein